MRVDLVPFCCQGRSGNLSPNLDWVPSEIDHLSLTVRRYTPVVHIIWVHEEALRSSPFPLHGYTTDSLLFSTRSGPEFSQEHVRCDPACAF